MPPSAISKSPSFLARAPENAPLAVKKAIWAGNYLVGRPYVWGLGAFGQAGVDKVIEMLLAEFTMVMRQTRTATLDQIGPQRIAPNSTPIMMRENRQGFGL